MDHIVPAKHSEITLSISATSLQSRARAALPLLTLLFPRLTIINLSVTGAGPLGHSTCGRAGSIIVHPCMHMFKLWGTKKRTIRVNAKNDEISELT